MTAAIHNAEAPGVILIETCRYRRFARSADAIVSPTEKCYETHLDDQLGKQCAE